VAVAAASIFLKSAVVGADVHETAVEKFLEESACRWSPDLAEAARCTRAYAFRSVSDASPGGRLWPEAPKSFTITSSKIERERRRGRRRWDARWSARGHHGCAVNCAGERWPSSRTRRRNAPTRTVQGRPLRDERNDVAAETRGSARFGPRRSAMRIAARCARPSEPRAPGCAAPCRAPATRRSPRPRSNRRARPAFGRRRNRRGSPTDAGALARLRRQRARP
jgi:hypothetical protein